MKFTFRGALGASFLMLLATPALAHHPMGGAIPSTLWEGFASGVGHPVIGIDHLAFIIAAGIVAAVAGLGVFAPVVFVVASLAGVGLHLALIDIPGVELIIALSVLLAGAMLAWNRSSLGGAVWMALFAIAGIFHGYAYGESIVGAEQSPLIAYFAGLALVQSLIGVAVAALASNRAWTRDALQPRLVGAAVFGVGVSAVAGQLFA